MGEHKQPRLKLGPIHKTSIYHREQIEKSKICGCFFCEKMFLPEQITEWVDPSDPIESDGRGRTALCPHCSIDSVIGDASGFEITPELLGLMKSKYFGKV
jgi:hypothetical protein